MEYIHKSLYYLARLAGFEPATYGLEVRCSIQLSYRRSFIRNTAPSIEITPHRLTKNKFKPLYRLYRFRQEQHHLPAFQKFRIHRATRF